MWFGYKEYMAHYYAYMTKVAEVRERERYPEAAKDANWCASIEEKCGHYGGRNADWLQMGVQDKVQR